MIQIRTVQYIRKVEDWNFFAVRSFFYCFSIFIFFLRIRGICRILSQLVSKIKLHIKVSTNIYTLKFSLFIKYFGVIQVLVFRLNVSHLSKPMRIPHICIVSEMHWDVLKRKDYSWHYAKEICRNLRQCYWKISELKIQPRNLWSWAYQEISMYA